MLNVLFVTQFLQQVSLPEVTTAFEISTTLPAEQPCKPPKPPNNGSVTVWGHNLIVEYTCDEGLYPVGSSFGSCDTTTGSWSIKRPLCVSSSCDPPEEVRDGKVYFDHGGGIAIVLCNEGYRLTGSATRHCDGYSWIGFRPKCRDVYYPRQERRHERDNITTTTSAPLTAESIQDADILDADNTCYHDFSEPPKVHHASANIVYRYNTKRRQWILIANYTCEDGFEFVDTSATYLYCKGYKWIGKKQPECNSTVLEEPDPCKNENGGCGHICLAHSGGRFSCDCKPGYTLGRHRKNCYDINECLMDNGGCEHTCINIEGSFFCLCLEGYIVSGNRCLETTETPTVVPLHQRSDVECFADSLAILLPGSLLPEVRNITWREDTCKVQHNGSHYLGTIQLTDCGTTVKIENDSVSFLNELIVHKADGSKVADNESVTFGEDYETVIPVKCIYPRYNNVSSSYIPLKQNARFFEKRYGDLDIAMQQFETEQFNSPVNAADYPRKIPLDDDVFIRVGLNFDAKDIRVKTDQCIATSMPSPADKNWRQLIHSGCPREDVRLLSKTESNDVKFTFKAFDFRHNSTGFVYIHCEVSVCDSSDPMCSMGCESRTKRSANNQGKQHLVSTGPLFVERKGQDSKDVVALPTVVAAVCVLVAMAAVIVAVIGWRRSSSHASAPI